MQPGDRAGRYIIEALLGAGGMGQVFRAYDDVLRRRVALKLLRAEGGSASDTEATVRRILREARMAAALEHANVVAIHDVGEHEGTPFLVMELVNGRSVRSLIATGEPMDERLRWLVDAARGLAAAHRAGLIHRDVKPENVVVREDGVVKVLDFGIARLTAVSTHTSRPPGPMGPPPPGSTPSATAGDAESTLAGTPAYMAPELIRGEKADARVDQFAWGVMAFETLSGRLPWSPDPSSVLSSVLYQAAPPLDPEAVGVSRDVTLTIERAMRKDRRERFGSMDEVVVALGGRALGESTRDVRRVASMPAHSSPELASAPTERATGSAGSLGAAAAGVQRRRRASRARAVLAIAVVGVASAAGWAVVRRTPTAPRTATTVAPAPHAGLAPAAFHPTDVRRLSFDVGCEQFPSLTPDGRVVVFDEAIGDDTHLVALDFATNERRVLTHERGWQYAAQLSPDGTTVAYVSELRDQRGTYFVPLDGSAPPRLFRAGTARPMWTPDGKSLWLGAGSRLSRIDVATGEVTRTIRAPPSGHLLIAKELADGRVLAMVLTQGNLSPMGLFLYAPGSEEGAPFVTANIEEVLTVTRDGTDVLFSKLLANEHTELWRAPLGGAAPAALGYNDIQPTKGLAIAGERVVWSTCRTDPVVSRLEPVAPGSRELRSERVFPPTDWVDFAAVGIPTDPSKLVLLSDRTGRAHPWIADLSNREAPREVPIGDLDAENLAVSPEGRLIGFSDAGHGGIYVVPIDGSAAPRRITDGASDRWPTFASDGDTVYFETTGPSGKRAIGAASLASKAPPSLVVDQAIYPSASPVADRLAYVGVIEGHDGGIPRILDRHTGKSWPIAASLTAGTHPGIAWSPDGSRIAIANGLQEIVEIDVARGTVRSHFATGDDLGGVTYAGTSLIVVRNTFGGDLWTARDSAK